MAEECEWRGGESWAIGSIGPNALDSPGGLRYKNGMPRSSRRGFLQQAGAAAAGAALVSIPRSFAAGRANEGISIGVIGCGGRGVQLGKLLNAEPDAVVLYTCDPDRHRAESARQALGARKAVGDLREILEDDSVDAVVIAACDHWHAPAAILAAQAGKYVYVEKPCSHNVREGRQMVEAARKHQVVMQHGTQSRSNKAVREAVAMLREGVIGEVLVAKHVNSQKRSNIGHQAPSNPPAHLNYDLWVGPAEWRDYQSNFVHYHWHWLYAFGTGDIGNDGAHGIDVARWGLGVDTHPSFVAGYGSKLFFDDDQEFPDTYAMTYEYPGSGEIGEKKLLIYEQRLWSPYRQDAEGNSTFFYGTEGMMSIGRRIRIYGPDNQPIREIVRGGSGDGAHQREFLDAIQEGGKRRPNADIEIGHLSSSLCHLGNLVARAGGSLRFDAARETILGDGPAALWLGRTYRDGHWAIPREA